MGSFSRFLVLLGTLLCLGTVQASPRVISLAPSLSEIMLELGAGDLLVGVLDGGERPAALSAVPSVGRYGQASLESIAALRPDLVLIWPGSVPASLESRLRSLGIQTLVVAPRRLDQLAEQFAFIGQAIGHAEAGERLAREFRERLANLRARYARPAPLRVFYQVWHSPLYTVGGGQIISDALRVCGAENVFADQTLPAPQVGVEAVLARHPDVILASDRAGLDRWQQWSDIPASRLGQLWVVPDKGLERPSFQMLGAIEKLCQRVAGARVQADETPAR